MVHRLWFCVYYIDIKLIDIYNIYKYISCKIVIYSEKNIKYYGDVSAHF